jgi:hypothetical protein
MIASACFINSAFISARLFLISGPLILFFPYYLLSCP